MNVRTGRSNDRNDEKSKGKRGFGRSNNQSNDRENRDDRRDKSPDDARYRKRRKTDQDRYKREIRLIELPIEFELATLDPFIKPFHSVGARFSTESLDLLDSIKHSKRYDRDARLSVVVEFESQQWVKQFYTAWNTRLIINKQRIKFETPSFIQPAKQQNEQRTSANQSNMIQSNPMAGLFQQTVDDDMPRVDQSVPQSINQFMKQFYVSPTQQPVRQPQTSQSTTQSTAQSYTSDPPHSQFSTISISHQQANEQPVQPLSIQQQYDLSAPLSLHSSEPTHVLCLRDLPPPCLDRDVIRYAFAAHSAIEWIHVSVPHASALIQFPLVGQAQNVKQLCDNQTIKLDKSPVTVMFAKPNPIEQPIVTNNEHPINHPINQSFDQSNMAFDAQSGRWYIAERGLYYDPAAQQWMPMMQSQAHQPVAQSHQTEHIVLPALLSDPKVFDCDKFICWLCERVFSDLKHLTWHAETSELHRANASAAKDTATAKYLHLMNEHRAIEVTEGVRPLLK